jgi:glucokinase
MKDGQFFQAFKDKWHFESLLKNIPVAVILEENAPQLGAAYEALRLVRS